MANGFGSFFVGNSGLQSAQNALNVVANNLANVNTAGYVRQQVIFSDKNYNTIKQVTNVTNPQQTGLGVSIGDVVHARDIFLDKAYRLENGREAFYDSCYEVVEQVQDLFQELDGQELKFSLQDLRTGFQQLAEAPIDPVNQNLVIQQSEILLGRFQALYADLQSYQTNLNNQIAGKVKEINDMGAKIYELNLYIQKVEAGGVETAMTARDQRDYLIDQLSKIANITYSEDASGFVSVQLEGTEFIIENGYNEIGLRQDDATNFYTPYWTNLSDVARGKYTDVYRNLLDISTDNNTDVGALKAILFQRGSGFGTYRDLLDDKSYARIEDCTLMESEAEVDMLFHEIATKMNDLLCPNTDAKNLVDFTIGGNVNGTDANGNPFFIAYDEKGQAYQISSDTRLLDSENTSVGSDGKLPPQELFTRIGGPRYTEVTAVITNAQGVAETKTFYVYKEEVPEDPSSWYNVTNSRLNSALKAEESLLPTRRQNGAVNYALAEALADGWDEMGMRIDPTDNSPCTFEGFYDKIIGKLGTDGNVYYSSKETLTTTVSSLDNQRQQVSGVSSDEELTNMIKYQQAYNAASRYITVISEMTELIVTSLI